MTLQRVGFMDAMKIADTLQGSVWRSVVHGSNQSVVVKATNKAMHANKMAIMNGTKFRVYENILNERAILKYLCDDKACPTSLTRLYGSFESNKNYYVALEDGGKQLFKFVQNTHRYIGANRIEIADWQQVVKVIFKQMLESVEYIHSKKVAHFDISLENFLITAVAAKYTTDGSKLEFVLDNRLQCKLCDFGLAARFKNDDFSSSKRCGKKVFQSPEVASNTNKPFDAKANDIWCLGVCLFMMLVGSMPWSAAVAKDGCFELVINGKLKQLLAFWKRDHYVTDDMVDLLQGIFQYEPKRMDIDAIKASRWLSN
eukprot:CAMPEP_0197032140 /NCGR_PEP_ID=MMETSP1384-20130603/10886_1 /TAXON_ID=29189 /ORGANISM="Ammonia sp." /LENGTH=313 /DNA_ID=CAMNT_0042461749 /DNA_START=78 /DNA_END=1019 /DNA_ORIENTATION=+